MAGRRFNVLVLVDDGPLSKQIDTTLRRCAFVARHGYARRAEDVLRKLPKGWDLLLIDPATTDLDLDPLLRSLAGQSRCPDLGLLTPDPDADLGAVMSLCHSCDMQVLGSLPAPFTDQQLNGLLHPAPPPVPSFTPVAAPPVPLDAAQIRQGLRSDAVAVAFQPQLFSKGGKLRAVEAFLRWRDPSGAIQPPVTVLPIAERCGLLPAINDQVLARAVKQLADWHAKGLSLRLCVKMPAPMLHGKETVEALMTLLEDASVKPSDIILHIESLPPDRSLVPVQQKTLSDLHDDGFLLSALCPIIIPNDFMLSRLSRVVFDEYRIDFRLAQSGTLSHSLMQSTRRFVTAVRDASKLAVAQNLESDADYQIAIDAGVDVVQGFYVSKPLFPAEFEAWHRASVAVS
ncbi:EAL domain-containing protein [Synechococcus sp. RSCCF101]|uniref:EAL domain-containing protein n=1 Tax=Synechococcus sp. RSCCF101 TaxID=2511069 RepID=UPI00177B963C|nr:EAL domain-containing protein [Synechococcus sp. RSCCF101]